jgi:DNA-binding transcriptional regulator LsrR (DeoR family)
MRTSEKDLAIRIAWLYYKEDMTQKEIAHRYNLSRSKVVRLLKRIKNEGIVHFHVLGPDKNCLPLERELVSKFNLQDSMVVPLYRENRIRETLGKAAAQYLETHLANGDILAVGWGKTIHHMANYIRSDEIKGLKIIALTGGLTPALYMNPYDVGGRLSSVFEGFCYYIHAPAITSSKELCESLKADLTIKRVLAMAKEATYCLVGIGEVGPEATLVKMGYVIMTDLEDLIRLKAKGDILGQFFNIVGEKIDTPLHRRNMAFPLEELRKMENVIGVAGGKNKLSAILGALRGRYIKILITDEETAKLLLGDRELLDHKGLL